MLGSNLLADVRGLDVRSLATPYAGTNRIRFYGTLSACRGRSAWHPGRV